ncbi:UDP-2,4-diacetamido-2,4,6-trideoxy-beta-L-altropyranose hydrolase [Desulfonauticus submarinus]|uniref:UDP-2,4-diacetamido-2,4,6-trideoxy-beta-L-altropyranose hydrolase n=1 Tax=Desulfonauticus submarinus TaxID=206665 RepID=A0A1H0BFW8_9BACT|nr:UDP-2,4-diacetamido-2,4,6-trideoxy-beta-L-altropyranose hydrolase [Desulfonauticus submarinus]SDN44526.1 UDP-2,4-diacetamido-2,4,6-trideoxy-beta-L-altropyranose hydrolase [Desulfonauticus submarinus]
MLIIRTDSTPEIGTGHIMRCIALAQAWQDRGGEVVFLSHCGSKLLRQRIQDEGFNLVSLKTPHPDSFDLEFTLAFLRNLKTSGQKEPIVVADGYHFDADYQKAIKENGYKLMVIDDYNHLPLYYADILLNQNINAPELNYSCSENTVQLLGCKYVMLRQEFLRNRNFKRTIPTKARNILVTMGGADIENITLKVLKAIYLLNDLDIEVKVIVGPSNPHLEEIKFYIEDKDLPASLIYSPLPEEMPEFMKWADLAITAGGSTCWELVFMGVPSLIITVAENQEGIGTGLEKFGAARNLGWFLRIKVNTLKEEIRKILYDGIREKMYLKSKKLIDGLGLERILYEVTQL